MERIFMSVLNMSLTASFVIATIILARLPLKKSTEDFLLCAVGGGGVSPRVPIYVGGRV